MEETTITNTFFMKDGTWVEKKPGMLVRDTGILDYLEEVIGEIHPEGRELIEHEHEFDHVVGETLCVETDEKSDIVYAIRPNRNGYSKFIMNRGPEPTRYMTVILKKDDKVGGYTITTAYFGRLAPREPWGPEVSEEQCDFWRTHALVMWSDPNLPKKGKRRNFNYIFGSMMPAVVFKYWPESAIQKRFLRK